MRRRALQSLCLVALLVTAGCAGFPGGGSSTTTSDNKQVVTDVRQAIQSIDTYRMTIDMSVHAQGDTYTLHRAGVFDATAKQARLNLTINGARTPAYLDGSTLYVNSGDDWRTRELARNNSWMSTVGLAQQRYLLENSTVTVSGTATVDGVETTVLTVHPRDGELKQLLTRRTFYGPEEVTIEEATYELYVAEETHRPLKAEMSLQITVDKNWDQSGHGSAVITFSGFNEPVNVTIPERATASSRRHVGATA